MTAESFAESEGFADQPWVLAWADPIADIPPGWAVCDGNNGTPDLRDRFVRGANGNAGTTGGANSRTVSEAQMPSHGHSGSLNSTGAHNHGISDSADAGSGDSGQTTYHSDTGGDTTLSGGNQDHTHGGNTGNAGNDSSYDNRPAYYEVVFIKPIA